MDDIVGIVGVLLMSVCAIALYFVPTIVAGQRSHHNMGAIVAVNLLFGWTFIGWAVALIWALSATDNKFKE